MDRSMETNTATTTTTAAAAAATTTTTMELRLQDVVAVVPSPPEETTTTTTTTTTSLVYCKVCTNDFVHTDVVTVAPCGCQLCKDCFINFMVGQRNTTTTTTKQAPQAPRCGVCQTIMKAHSYLKINTREPVEYIYSDETNSNNQDDHLLPQTHPLPPPENDDVCDQRIIRHAVLTAAAEVAAECMHPAATTTTATEKTTTGPVDDAVSPSNHKKRATTTKKKTPSSSSSTDPKCTKNKKGKPSSATKKRKRASTTSATATAGGGETSDTPGTKKRKNWKFAERLRELQSFKEQHGHCNVRRHEGEHQDLGKWLYDVIRGRRKITDEQRQQILDVGVDLTAAAAADGTMKIYNKRKSFAERFADLQEYKRRVGHCHVPYRPEHKDDQALAEWVKDVRRGQIKINMAQRKQLNELGFNWETKYSKFEREWNDRFKQLTQYQERHKHTRVALNDDKVLYEWCNTQRKLRNKDQLREDRKERLDKIGFWDRTISPHRPNSNTMQQQQQHTDNVPEQFRGNDQHHRHDGESSRDDEDDNDDSIYQHHRHNNEIYRPPPAMMVAARRTDLSIPFFRHFG